MPRANRKRARRSIPFRLALVLGSSLVALILAELGTRVVLYAKGDPYDGAALRVRLEQDVDPVAAFTPPENRGAEVVKSRSLHPFFGAQRGLDPGGVMAHFESGRAEETFDVLVVGGSVAMLFCRDAGEDLERALEQNPRLAEREVVVLNGAHAAYKQPQQLNKVALVFAEGHRPDVVLNLDGFNEVAQGLRNGLRRMDPMYPSPPVWAGPLRMRTDYGGDELGLRGELTRVSERHAELVERAERWGLLRSAVCGTIVANRANALQNERLAIEERLTDALTPESTRDRELQDTEIRGRQRDLDRDEVLELVVESWVECSISLAAICRVRDVPYVHALQPTLWDEGAKPMTAKERKLQGSKEWKPAVRLGYPMLRAAIPRLEAEGIPFVDLSRTFAEVEETLYYDPCHFVADGAKMMVDDVARAIVDALP